MTPVQPPPDTDVVIIGGGPVGLLLGCRLAQLGISFTVLEQHVQPSQHSRSIGIHPPSLELLELAGVVDEAIKQGVAVTYGQAFLGAERVGKLSFRRCKPPYTFVLTLPQHATEAILERRLGELRPGALIRGATLTGFSETATGISITFRQQDQAKTLRARYLVGCDGRRSSVRQHAKLGFTGKAYPDTYLMGDFIDTTGLGPDAGIFLTREGVVESFPLPGNTRRWVVKTRSRTESPTAEDLAAHLLERLNYTVPAHTNTMLSAFGVEHFLAKRMAWGRVLLAGDAAHVISPIGGQGMNLGWFDAWAAAEALYKIVKLEADSKRVLASYQRTRLATAKKAAVRAEFNMRLGRRPLSQRLNRLLVWLILKRPLQDVFTRLFTMRWL